MILQLKGVNKDFSGEYLLRDVSFSVDERDKIGLIGMNGTGKTTLVKIIVGEENDTIGDKSKEKGDVSRKKGLKIGYLSQHIKLNYENSIFQEMMEVFSKQDELYLKIEELNSEVSFLGGEELSEKLDELAKVSEEYESIGGYNVEYKIKQVLNGLNVEEVKYTLAIKNLSGGQRSRVALAKILLEDPDLLILDEPTNHLDMNAIEWLEKYLRDYKKAFLLISHDRYFLDSVCNRTFEIENKKVETYKGNFSDYLIQKELILSGKMKAYEKEQYKIKNTEEFIRKYKAGIKSKQARGREKILDRMEKMEDPRVPSNRMKMKFEIGRASVDRVLKVEKLKMEFEDNELFSDVNFNLYKGERVGIIGKNGVGKSTILKIINGVIESSGGKFEIGQKVDIGYYDQEHNNLNKNNSILEELQSSFMMTEERARSMAGGFLFPEEDVFKEISKLSGGERARVSLMKLMLKNPNFLILDEPTNHIDIFSKEVLEESLEEYDGTLLLVSHDRHFLEKVCNKIYFLDKNGVEIFDGNYEEYKKRGNKNREDSLEVKEEKESRTIDYEEQKKKKNRFKQLAKACKSLEMEIESLEEEKESCQNEYDMAGVKNDVFKLMEIQEMMSGIEIKIERKMEEWEEYELELMDFDDRE